MFIITKTFTDDEGHLFTKVNPKQYSTPGEAYDAMREDYLNELKSRGLEDNGSSNDSKRMLWVDESLTHVEPLTNNYLKRQGAVTEKQLDERDF